MKTYIGIVHKDPQSDFGISFPDFPGCISAGSTLDELRWMAHEALNFHIEGMLEDCLEIPDPSDLKKILKDPDYQDPYSILLVEAETPQTLKNEIRVNVSFPKKALNEIDNLAKAMGLNRSDFIILATKAYQISQPNGRKVEKPRPKTKRKTG